ncbi:MltA-interacting MipA family protein [Desulfobulbus rhabdoformis]|uniref:TorF family putative porin n=1 Tax=Desulfobulbus rhabdoformis TaxID=34032 RepID=UPI0019651F0A|nr:TorF family putative porin [Desulfobulbus rhabdoformis]MBM9616036.1 MltA-interacting MipA family protein [Desulfobulbus rhabdoformis]
MKRLFSMAALAALTLTGAASQAEAATATAAVDINSAYVWRGMTFNDGMVIQPSIDVAAENGFSINVWGNFDVDDYDGAVDDGEFSEIDLTANYAFTLSAVDMNVGVIHYTFPGVDADSTTEIYAGASYGLGYGFTIGGTVYFDVDEANGVYATLDLGYSYDINDKTNLSLGGTISYASEDDAEFFTGDEDADGGFFNYILSASLSYQVTDAVGIGANIAFTESMDDDVLVEDAVDTTFYGGVSLSYTF